MEGSDIKQIGVTINIDKERHLIFDLNSFCDLEDKYGTIEKALGEMGKGSIKAIRYMLYLGLLNEDESLNEKKVGKLIKIENLGEVMNALKIAIAISAPEVKPDIKN
jgi:hypothetical protein